MRCKHLEQRVSTLHGALSEPLLSRTHIFHERGPTDCPCTQPHCRQQTESKDTKCCHVPTHSNAESDAPLGRKASQSSSTLNHAPSRYFGASSVRHEVQALKDLLKPSGYFSQSNVNTESAQRFGEVPDEEERNPVSYARQSMSTASQPLRYQTLAGSSSEGQMQPPERTVEANEISHCSYPAAYTDGSTTASAHFPASTRPVSQHTPHLSASKSNAQAEARIQASTTQADVDVCCSFQIPKSH